MSKGKPNRAFLEAIQNEKRNKPTEGKSGAFNTPAWFFNRPPATDQPKSTGSLMQPAARRSRLPFKLTYKHGILAGSVLAVVVVAIFLTGKTPPLQSAQRSTPELRQDPPNTSVLDVSSSAHAVPNPPPVAIPVRTSDLPEATGRVIGMNYAVIQSYPDEKGAADARDALIKSGIPCTVEKNHPFAPKWYCVIGTTGFAKSSTHDYQEYVRKIQAVSDKFAGSSKFRKFDPQPYKWR